MRVHSSDEGSSALEFAGFLPVVLVVMVMLIQGAVALYTVTAATTSARHGARAYSLGDDPDVAAEQALPSWLDANVTTFGPGYGVRVEVDVPKVVPGMDFTVSRQAVMP